MRNSIHIMHQNILKNLSQFKHSREHTNISQPKILIIEDEHDEREIMKDSLNEIGYRCSSACDGFDGIAQAKALLFDLCIVDIRMQGMNGMQVIDQLKALYPQIPVIAISGYLSDDHIKQGYDKGFVCLQKPFSMEILSDTIVTILGTYPQNTRKELNT